MAKDVKFNIRLAIDGKEQIVTASADVKRFAKELEIARTESTKIRDELLKITQVSASFQNVISGLQQLTGVLRTYTTANAAQIEAETKLANNMRNTMRAREEDIQSIKDLCSAQQQAGVIGDEVQLSGAQELATYLERKSSLEKLIPVMNDMLAQQYGLNATQESAVNIASMLGKVMSGQVNALSRYGYKFNEAQEQVLKYGTESQRAAVLAEVVEEAVGGMNAELAKTDAGKAKQMANTVGDLKESVGRLFAQIEPTIVAAGELGVAFLALGTTIQGVRGAYIGLSQFIAFIKNSTFVTWAHVAATKAAAFVQALWNKQLYLGRKAAIAWAFGAKIATIQATALRVAIVGLMSVTGVGLVLLAATSIVSLFTNKMGDATNGLKETNREVRRVEEETKRLKEVEDAATEAYTRAASALSINKEKLKGLIDAKKTGKDVSVEEKRIVGHLNDTYGDTMGYFANIETWYKALIKNSETYCKQMVLEAKTRQLANQIAEKEADTHNLLYDDKGNKKQYSTKRTVKRYHTGVISAGDGKAIPSVGGEWVETLPSEAEKIEALIADNRAIIENLKRQMQDAIKDAGELDFEVKGSDRRKEKVGGDKEKALIKDAKTYKDLANNIAYYQQELEKVSVTDTKHIIKLSKAKKAAEDAAQRFKDFADEVNTPRELKTLDDYDKRLQYLQKKRQAASKETIAGIEAEIKQTEEARKTLEESAVLALKDEEIKTHEQLNKKLAYYNRLLENGDEAQRRFAQQGINALGKLKSAWDTALEEATLPVSMDSLQDIDTAISFYTDRQQREDADGIQKTQKIIDTLLAKKKVLQLGTELPQLQKEVSEIEGLDGKERRLRIKDIGFDELTEKIRELNKLLNDTENPLTDTQRIQVEGLIALYEKWRRQSVSTFGAIRDGWSGVRGIGAGIDGITHTLEGNQDAWQKIAATIDGVMQLYDGVRTIIDIVEMLTTVTAAHTAAKTAEGAATGTTIAATAAAATANEAAAVAAIPVIATNKLATASYMELAGAMYFAAHAFIPFAGFGIAAGFVTAATAMVQSIGVMPFAKGGVVSGPTLALIGEYSGASNNPEVVAPLDKLKNMIQPAGEVGGVVRFEIEGRKLVGVIANETRISSKSGRRTNIKI